MPNPVLLQSLKIGFGIAKFFSRPTPPFKPQNIKRILIVNTTAIGDTLLSTAAIRQIRKRYPEARLVALVSKMAASMLQGNPHLDAMITHPGRVNLRYLFLLPRLLREIRREHFDLAVVLHANDPDIVPLLFLSGIVHRYGWAESRLAFLLTMPVQTRQDKTHALTEKTRNLKILDIDSNDERMELHLTPEEEANAFTFLREHGINKPYICLHPFGNRRNRWWIRADYLQKLEVLLREKIPEIAVIVIGGPREKVFLINNEVIPKKFIVAVDELKIRETAALIKNSRVTISTDSGPLHMAQAFGVKTLGIFGPSSPMATGPQLPNALVVQAGADCSPCSLYKCEKKTCTDDITPEMVITALLQLWHAPE